MYRRDFLQNMMALGALSVSPRLVQAVESGVRAPSHNVFDPAQKALCSQLTEIIIPTTDTPGAIAAGVPQFIEFMVADWYTDTERKLFFDGLQALETHCVSEFGANFVNCSTTQQDAALSHFESLAASYQSPPELAFTGEPDVNTPFFSKLKELTVFGYYSSEIGATQELKYVPMPMTYRGDATLEDSDGRQYSY